eukprot:TRINITY_DN35924_c0_g1_i1.p2 TRINITY_DN35924_c0_g1~~TRINITY_DN35924_c0_g1_i1.p2  ORF type:complete len:160 (+),score=30.05 TRINITY_DN35924_c0_g1_i1:72-482(+)
MTQQTRNARMFNQHEDEFPDDSPSSLTINRTGKATYSLAPGFHLYSGSQSLLYRGSLSDNGTIILCRVQQSTADGALLYTRTVQLQLMVRELVISQSTSHGGEDRTHLWYHPRHHLHHPHLHPCCFSSDKKAEAEW